jgi:hypothetical protein
VRTIHRVRQREYQIAHFVIAITFAEAITVDHRLLAALLGMPARRAYVLSEELFV